MPRIRPDDDGDPDWYPLQHYFGLTGFGANVYVAQTAERSLIAEHDETAAGHQELYVVISGRARFRLDGEEYDVGSGDVVAVRDPQVRRQAIALEPGTTLLAVGARPDENFRSSWQPHHFDGVPRAE